MKYLLTIFCLMFISSCQMTPEQWEEFNKSMDELNEGLAKANDSLNAGNPNYRRNNNTQSNQQPLKRTVTGQLQSEYVSGYNKICTYKGISGEFTKTISRAYTCPLYETIEID
jgi:uncharacterized protein YukE